MSAANRGRERLEDDTYLTPMWCVERALEKINLPGGHWLEPCAGEGHVIATVNSLRDDVTWSACEIRKESLKKLKNFGFDKSSINDFLKLDESRLKRFDVVLTNPPYSLAQEFLEKCLRIANNVVFLLRVNYLGSETRADWLRSHVPDVYQLPNRPSFQVFISDVYACNHCDHGKEKNVPMDAKAPRCQGCGKEMFLKGQKKSSSDASEYAWMHWVPGERREGKLVILNSTPKSVRKQLAA